MMPFAASCGSRPLQAYSSAPRPRRAAMPAHFDLLGSAAHRAIAREAVRKSLVLLKNHHVARCR